MVERKPVPKVPGVYTVARKDGTLRYGAVVDVRGAWGRDRVQRRRETFETLAAAKKWRTLTLAEVMGGKVATGGSRTFGWWVNEWMEMREGEWEYGTALVRKAHLARFDSLFPVALEKIGPADIESVMVRVRRVLAPATAAACRGTASSCFGAAVRYGLIARNPVDGTSRGATDRTAKSVWDSGQVKTFLDATVGDERYGVLWRLLAETWMRIGEACGLRWSDFDLVWGTVAISRTMRISGDGWVVGTTAKTKGANRTLPISPVMVAMLTAYKDRQRFRGVMDTVFDTNPDACRAALRRACDAAGIARVGPHMFRHAGATMAARAGMDHRLIQQRLGHTNVSFTLQRYVHPSEDDHRKAGDLVAALLG